MADKTLRELQTNQPWSIHYHHDFRASPVAHKDFGHALLHVQKAVGKLAAVVNEAEHGGDVFAPVDVDRYIADLIICAIRMANTCPGRKIDIQRVVEDRIADKNSVNPERKKPLICRYCQMTVDFGHVNHPPCTGSETHSWRDNL